MGRAFSPGLGCPRGVQGLLASSARHHATVYHHGHAHDHLEEEIFAIVFAFSLFFIVCLCCATDQSLVGASNIAHRESVVYVDRFNDRCWRGTLCMPGQPEAGRRFGC